MAKYSIIFFCSLFSCFIAVFPLSSINLQNEGNNHLPSILDILRINATQGKLKDGLVKSVAPSRQAFQKGWYLTASSDEQNENVKRGIRTSSNVSKLEPRESLAFHTRRGIMATLSKDLLTATKKSRDGGLAVVYTNRRLERNELFEIKITEMEPNCTTPNPLTFGVSLNEPDYLGRIPNDIFVTDSPTWMIHWMHFFHSTGTGFENIYTEYLPYLPKEGDTLGVLHQSDGGILFYLNGSELPISGGTDGSLVPFIEMHGCYKSIQFYNRTVFPLKSMNLQNEGNNKNIVEIDATHQRMKHDLVNNGGPSPQMTKPEWVKGENKDISKETEESEIDSMKVSIQELQDSITFNDHHGVMASLSEDKRTATKMSRDGGLAFVYTNRRLERNELFEIKISEMEPDCNTPNPFTFGVALSEPRDTILTSDIFVSDSQTWMIYWTNFFHSSGSGFENIYADYLPSIPKGGDKLGVLHKSDGGLYFYFNGMELPLTAGSDANVFAFVEMNGCYKSVQIN